MAKVKGLTLNCTSRSVNLQTVPHVALNSFAAQDPASMTTAEVATSAAQLTLTVPGAALGDPCVAGISTATTAKYSITAQVTAVDTVTVTFINSNGAAVDLSSGTVKVVVFKF